MTIERVAPSVVRARVGKATVSLSVVTGHIMASAPGGAIADLRAHGVTIVQVTHNEGYAKEAQRSVRLFDGWIDKADATADIKQRNGFLQEATKVATREIPMILPLRN